MIHIENLISEYCLKGSKHTLKELNAIKSLAIEDKLIKLSLKLPFVYDSAKVIKQLEAILPNYKLDLILSISIASYQRLNKVKPIVGIKNIIAISSGKGGVGKSTTAVNIAIALQLLGANVGLLDADMYGPSIPHMLGQEEAKPISPDQKTMLPIQAHGIVSNSIGYLTGVMDPTIWRGPVASTMLTQLLTETQWNVSGQDLDYLIIDMPPGTGDLQLTLAQKIPVNGGVIVTTPQEIALLDVVKGINMFKEVHVPIIGIIENMSFHICSNCGHVEATFGLDGGKDLAEISQVELLGTIPLNINLRRDLDLGEPTVIANPESDLAEIYRDTATRISIQMSQELKLTGSPIQITQL